MFFALEIKKSKDGSTVVKKNIFLNMYYTGWQWEYIFFQGFLRKHPQFQLANYVEVKSSSWKNRGVCNSKVQIFVSCPCRFLEYEYIIYNII